MAGKPRSLIGNTYGRLTVIRDSGERTARRGVIWECRCSCGSIKNIAADPLTRGATVSCGCYGVEARREGVMNSTKKLSPNQKDEICRLYESGETSPQIAVKFSIDQSSVRSIIHARGVNSRGREHCNRTHSLDENAFSFITDSSAYWAGFIAADGCVHGRSLMVALHSQDINHIHKLRSFLSSSHAITIDRRGFPHLNINSAKIVSDLNRLGITENKSKTFVPPKSLEMNSHFWRGVVDGDGHIRKDGCGIELVGSEPCITSFLAWCRTIAQIKSNVRKHKTIFGTAIIGKLSLPILHALYETDAPSLDRKRQTYINGARGIYLRALVDHPGILDDILAKVSKC